MTITEACVAILGHDAAAAIIRNQGIRWAVVAAMAVARTSDDPSALEAIDRYNKSKSAA
jgi:hypothetical protein